ncbi:MAG: hypothetical protein ACLP01_17690 [Solirubrobacteraceae bacterium]
MTSAPVIELLWWEGCPSTEQARMQLQAALGEIGLERTEIRMVEVRTDAQAWSLDFPGSPTIRINGVDLLELARVQLADSVSADAHSSAPACGPAPAALTCRVYRRRDGRISPLPDPEDVREALLYVVAHPCHESLSAASPA